MPLPVSGAISFNNINVELGVAGTTQASLGQASYRTLAGVPSGQISMSNFYGKANQFAFAIASNQTNANLRTLALNAGWNGTSKVVATINSGVYCSSNSTGTPGLTVNGSFPNGVELINQGFIIGMGGNGGNGEKGGPPAPGPSGSAGSSGGTALSVSVALTLNNTGTIGGGGGGGGGGQAISGYPDISISASGGGGGGGRSSAAANSAGGPAGQKYYPYAGGVGGNGGAGTSSSAGGGGGGFYTGSGYGSTGGGGSGGGWGSSGSSGANAGSGSYGSAAYGSAYSGGAGGAAISGNSNITYIATGTRLGAIS